jgi:hypothetical protein
MNIRKIATPRNALRVLLLGFVGASVIMMAVKGLRPAGGARPGETLAEAPARQIVTYYFHRNVRCDSCRTIERLTGETLEKEFARELASGRVAWRVVNVETPGNEHFLTDYDQTGQSVIVSDRRDGREARWKDLVDVWDLLHDEAGFREYVRDEVRAYLEAPAERGEQEEAK